MSGNTEQLRSSKRAHDTSMTVLSSLAVITVLAVAAACSSGGSDEAAAAGSWTAKPGTTDLDGSAADGADGDATDTPAVPLCKLTGAPASSPGEVLVYSEDFNGTAIDPLGWGVINGYVGHGGIANTSVPSSIVVSDGTLKIVTATNPADTVHPYTSGRIDTAGKFARTYGKVEFRARFPYAAGVWYAIWGRPWSQPYPEIDIEVVNRPTKPNTELYFVNHWAAPTDLDGSPVAADSRRSYVMDDKHDVADWHVYTLHWVPGAFYWEKDGVTIFTAQPQGVPDIPETWIMNGWVGGWPGNPDSTTPFPVAFEVDYMHVYRVDGLVGDPLVRVMNPKTAYATTAKVDVATANFDEVCTHVEMYDGDKLLQTLGARPFRFALSRLAKGAHTITFVATDGARRTTTSMQATIN